MQFITNTETRDYRVYHNPTVSVYGDTSLDKSLRKELAMATLKLRRGNWYARVQWWNNHQRKEKQIPLRTDSKVTARERLAMVNKLESDIKDGINFSFPWLNDDVSVKILKKSLKDGIDEYISFKRLQGLTESSIQRTLCTLNNLINFMGSTYPIRGVTHKHIHGTKGYVDYCLNKKKPMTKVSVNLELRNLKTFFKWCAENEHMDKAPKITMIKVPKTKPKYMTEKDICAILSLDNLEAKWKRIFCFYIATGVRRAEPFFGQLDGSWLIIPEEHTKAKKEKEIHLSPEMIQIWKEMMLMKDEWVDNGYSLTNLFGKITKQFKRAVREAGVDDCLHLHNTRHTFAVRRYLETEDIFGVKQELGHSSVTVTEMYAEFRPSRLESDFPTLTKNKVNSHLFVKEDTVMEDTTPLLST